MGVAGRLGRQQRRVRERGREIGERGGKSEKEGGGGRERGEGRRERGREREGWRERDAIARDDSRIRYCADMQIKAQVLNFCSGGKADSVNIA